MLNEMIIAMTATFTLGLLHALDADHILAVSVLSSEARSVRRSAGYALRWSAAHGMALLVFTLLLQQLGSVMSHEISHRAEQLVGLVMLLLGLLLVWRIVRQGLELKVHRHEGMHAHLHWQSKQQASATRHDHRAYLLGGLHGMAGFAALLAVMPMFSTDNMLSVFGFILLFSSGLFLAMMAFGGAFGFALQKLARYGRHYLKSVQLVIALLTMAMGVHLVLSPA